MYIFSNYGEEYSFEGDTPLRKIFCEIYFREPILPDSDILKKVIDAIDFPDNDNHQTERYIRIRQQKKNTFQHYNGRENSRNRSCLFVLQYKAYLK